jgi:hypothetical protein
MRNTPRFGDSHAFAQAHEPDDGLDLAIINDDAFLGEKRYSLSLTVW